VSEVGGVCLLGEEKISYIKHIIGYE
jgi:hypothetical protein